MKCVIPERCNGPVVRSLSRNSKGPEIDSDRGISRVRIFVALDTSVRPPFLGPPSQHSAPDDHHSWARPVSIVPILLFLFISAREKKKYCTTIQETFYFMLVYLFIYSDTLLLFIPGIACSPLNKPLCVGPVRTPP